jgi:hypothetical protein
MRRLLTAAALTALLFAGQAAANAVELRAGDRVGAASGETDELMGVPILPLIMVLIPVVWGVTEELTDDDPPESP